MNSLGVCSLEQLAKDGSRYFGVAQGTVTVRYVDVQVLRDQVELEATQAGEEAPGQWNGIQAIDRKAIVEQLRLVREEADIEAKIMPDKRGAIDKAKEAGKNSLGLWCARHHFLGDTCKANDERRQMAAWINQALKRAGDLSAAQPDARKLDDAIGSGTQPGGLGVEDDKVGLIKRLLSDTPGRERPF